LSGKPRHLIAAQSRHGTKHHGERAKHQSNTGNERDQAQAVGAKRGRVAALGFGTGRRIGIFR
jgi:hypothetical protein